VLRLEDYSADMARHLDAVFSFAGLRDPTPAEWTAILDAPRANSGASGAARALLREPRAPIEPMLPETRAALTAFYAPFNEELAALLGDERFAWRA
jgi:hypothetical protein